MKTSPTFRNNVPFDRRRCGVFTLISYVDDASKLINLNEKAKNIIILEILESTSLDKQIEIFNNNFSEVIFMTKKKYTTRIITRDSMSLR